MTGNLFVSLQSKSAGRQAGIDADDKLSGLRQWVQLAHAGGSLLVAQLNHGGRQMVESGDENPEELLEAKQLGDEIERAIGKLRPEYRTAILLRHVDGREYQEIAEIMALPLGTVKTYIHRGRNELKNALAHLRC